MPLLMPLMWGAITLALALAVPGAQAQDVVAWDSAWGGGDSSLVPPGLTGISQLSAGYDHVVALRSNGTVVCWGNNGSGQCTPPQGLDSVTQVVAGPFASYAIKTDGTIVTWGADNFFYWDHTLKVKQLAAAEYHALYITADGQARHRSGWDPAIPDQGGARQVAVGFVLGVVLKADSTVLVWEHNSWLGWIIKANPPGLGSVVQVAAPPQGYHVVALRNDGTVAAWSENDDRQCDVPVGLTGITQVAAGRGSSMALRSDGTVAGWGTQWKAPPSGLSGVTQIVASQSAVVALSLIHI